MNTPTQIVLLGGGYVSIRAYQALVRQLQSQLADGHVEITVICPTTHHVFYGWSAEVLTDILQPESQLSLLSEIMPHARLIRGQATAVGIETKTVHVSFPDGSQQVMISYDHLILGIGSVDSEAINGIRQYGYQIKSPDAFLNTKATIQSLIERAANENSTMARNLLTFVVAGGGFTAVELATNLVEYIGILKKQYPSLQAIDPQVRLVHSGDRVLPTLEGKYNRLVRYAEKTMAQHGIELFSNCRVKTITADGAYLQNGSFLSASMVISAIGQSQIQLPGTGMMMRDRLQRLHTNSYLQIPGYTNIWGGGDACHVNHFYSDEACPANVFWAIKHGDHLGCTIARAIKGLPLKPFTYRGLGQFASFGVGKGIAELYGFQFTGVVAWLMRWVFFNYIIPSRKVRLQGLSDWLFLAFRKQRKGLWIKQEAATHKKPTDADALLIL